MEERFRDAMDLAPLPGFDVILSRSQSPGQTDGTPAQSRREFAPN